MPLAPRVRGIRGDPAPAPRARGPSHPVGFLRADVGGSKQLPAPYKAVRAARAGRPCRVRSGARASQRAQAPGAERPPVPAGAQPAAARQDHGCPFQAAREEDALAACPAQRALGSSRGRARSSPAHRARRAPQEVSRGRAQRAGSQPGPARVGGGGGGPRWAPAPGQAKPVLLRSSVPRLSRAVPSLRATAGAWGARALRG